MAGHSKWANIKHRKGKQDAKRGKIFTKLIREITVAARGGDDLSMNPALRLAVDKANQQNMPKDTIKRAIDKGAGNTDGAALEDAKYEGYGPAGVAVWVHCLTDNRNRTVAEVRHALNKAGGNLGTEGSVSYQFQQKGIIVLPATLAEDAVFDVALEAGADDISADNYGIEVVSSPQAFEAVRDAMLAQEWAIESSELVWVADNTIDLDEEASEKVMRLQDVLEDLDDVQAVYTNAQFADAAFEDAGT